MLTLIHTVMGYAFIALAYYTYRQHKSLKKARNEFREENQNFTLALHAGGIEIWGYDVSNDQFISIYSPRMPKGGGGMESCDLLFTPKDSKRFQNDIQSIINGSKERIKATYHFRYPNEDEWSIIEKEMTGVKDKHGKIVKVIGTHKDITGQLEMAKNMELSLMRNRIALETAQMTLFEIDFRANVLRSYNDPLSGNEPMSVFKFDTMHRMMHPDDLENAKKQFRCVIRNPKRVVTFTARMKYPDNEWHYCTFSARAFTFNSETGKVETLLGYRHDITEQIKVQKRLEEEKEKAQKADKLKSAFLANMSHEIRTPLNAIVGFSNLLCDTENIDERKEFVDIINKNNELLLGIINDVIDLAKIESGNVEISRDEVDLADSFNQLCEMLRANVTSRTENVEFIVDSPYRKCRAIIDTKRMWQVMTNFTTNAAKHTKEGHIKVGYRQENNGLLMYVEDTGCGIPDDKKEKVFERFVKLDSFTQGAGLGLSICKAIINSSKGHIDIDSELGKGSTFSAWVPCEIEAEALN